MNVASKDRDDLQNRLSALSREKEGLLSDLQSTGEAKRKAAAALDECQKNNLKQERAHKEAIAELNESLRFLKEELSLAQTQKDEALSNLQSTVTKLTELQEALSADLSAAAALKTELEALKIEKEASMARTATVETPAQKEKVNCDIEDVLVRTELTDFAQLDNVQRHYRQVSMMSSRFRGCTR